ncbi:NAD-dependent epimerase/dehydratase family protein [Neolewinella aurantiaca]|uniref:NAD-dependent epimerase/dehydratase family protein n=1 Tax=Neolewinella aurantiaca TaxID=2602767 RepID=A0A5C7FJL6_9BACT|nr:NAD-dependent epimerase/dehydratase family protein [Neolewinella aurantiaca]TXF90078.1 NAD-dependent epimerase/dehydratase family protein [Neolewinella aurantiaca]
MKPIILVTGANGQLGSVLIPALRNRYGTDNVIASDLRGRTDQEERFEVLDATDEDRMTEIVRRYGVTQIYHLAAILSANGEKNPVRTWDVNMQAFLNVLEVSRKERIEKVFYPSSIAVFGESAPLENTPNDAFLDPLTSYGISKAAGENWAKYYFVKYGLDVRSVRYPGVIGYQSDPGGGTTDYAVEIFHYAVREQPFSCFLNPDEKLPMIFMDDAIRATIELMEAPKESITNRSSYNLAGLSFSPAELTAAIQKHCPDFRVSYTPDDRQNIAAKWPNSIDDSAARTDWGWEPEYKMEELVETMLTNLRKKYEHEKTRLNQLTAEV